MRSCALDTGDSCYSPPGGLEDGGLLISRARATRGLRRMGWAAWSSSCSRNAHAPKMLVRRAHSKIDQVAL
jgi:hypothetical protein